MMDCLNVVTDPNPEELQEAEMDLYTKSLVHPVNGKYSLSLPTKSQTDRQAVQSTTATRFLKRLTCPLRTIVSCSDLRVP